MEIHSKSRTLLESPEDRHIRIIRAAFARYVRGHEHCPQKIAEAIIARLIDEQEELETKRRP